MRDMVESMRTGHSSSLIECTKRIYWLAIYQDEKKYGKLALACSRGSDLCKKPLSSLGENYILKFPWRSSKCYDIYFPDGHESLEYSSFENTYICIYTHRRHDFVSAFNEYDLNARDLCGEIDVLRYVRNIRYFDSRRYERYMNSIRSKIFSDGTLDEKLFNDMKEVCPYVFSF